MSKQIQVVTHTDLDGVVSYLCMCWLYGKKLSVIGTTPRKLKEDYDKLIASNTEWEKIYFLDLDVSSIGELIDHKNTIIIDHHKTNVYSFQKATRVIQDYTSCSKLIYEKLFKPTQKELSVARKQLIALADDVDSNKKSTTLSSDLNIVYHSMRKKFSSFVEEFYGGFKPFDKFQQNSINLYHKNCKDYIENLTPFRGTIEFEGQKDIKVGAVFCDKFVQECCDWLLTSANVDIAIAVMVDQQRIAVRRHPNVNNVDVSKFVQRIALGGGHEAAAGGNITDEFVEFTKLLKE